MESNPSKSVDVFSIINQIFSSNECACKKCKPWFEDPNNHNLDELCEKCRPAMGNCSDCGRAATKEEPFFQRTREGVDYPHGGWRTELLPTCKTCVSKKFSEAGAPSFLC